MPAVAETRYARFLGSVVVLDDRTRSRLAQVDHRDHEALTAVTPDGGRRRDRALVSEMRRELSSFEVAGNWPAG